MLPEAINTPFQLTEADYSLLREAMSQRPRESNYPRYDKPDNYVKFWIYGDQPEETRIPENVRILNKVGWAYGYLTDAAYITDGEVEFILVGTIHTNANRIYNDGVYETDEVGMPFFGQLGRAMLDFERGAALETQGADLLAKDDLTQVGRLVDVENDDGQVVFGAEGEGGLVHHP